MGGPGARRQPERGRKWWTGGGPSRGKGGRAGKDIRERSGGRERGVGGNKNNGTGVSYHGSRGDGPIRGPTKERRRGGGLRRAENGGARFYWGGLAKGAESFVVQGGGPKGECRGGRPKRGAGFCLETKPGRRDESGFNRILRPAACSSWSPRGTGLVVFGKRGSFWSMFFGSGLGNFGGRHRFFITPLTGRGSMA